MPGTESVQITGPSGDRYDEILTPRAIDLIAALHAELGPRRYEALAADPRGQLVTLLEHLQLTAPGQELDFLDGARADLRPTHGIAGNPMLFDRAAGVSLRVDDAWRTSMSRRRQLMVSTLTWPMLKRYGY